MYGLGLAKGLVVTMKNFFRTPFTVQYPEQRLTQHPRFRGEEFAWYEERCTGCASCAKYCPLGIIRIVTSPSETAIPQGDKYKLEVMHQLNTLAPVYRRIAIEGLLNEW